MRFRSINIFSGEKHDGNRKKELTKMMRNDSNRIVDAYLQSFKYYDNEKCISLNISCDENINEMYIEEFSKGYPILHISFDLEEYVQMRKCDKDKFWLSVVYDSVKYVSSIWNWEMPFFENVYNKCLIRLESKPEELDSCHSCSEEDNV